MEKRTTYVLLPNGTREEAAEAGGILSDPGRALIFGSGAAHTAGQALDGDVVVIGREPATIDADATGTVTRYASLHAMRRALKASDDPAPVRPEPVPAEPEVSSTPGPEPEPDSPPAPGPTVPAMSRQEMIQRGARKWPGQRPWATMTNEALAEALKTMEARD
jgi:hypothetical protein